MPSFMYFERIRHYGMDNATNERIHMASENVSTSIHHMNR